MEASLRLHHHQPGTLTGLGEYLFGRTSGMIGSLSQLIRGAAILAIADGTEQITRDLLNPVPVDHAAERAATGGPAAGARPRPRRDLLAEGCRSRCYPPGTKPWPPTWPGWRTCTAWTRASCGTRSAAPQPGTRRRVIDPGRLAVITGRPAEHLARALPELRRPEPDWQAWRHQPQPGCPRCDARYDGGPVTRLLPHHRYVCTRHRYWIGPPDAGQPATPLGAELASIVQAQWRHLRLLRRHGPAAAYDAVLTGFLLCGHLWTDQPGELGRAMAAVDPPGRDPHPARRRIQPVQRLADLRRRLPRSRRPRQPHRLARLAQPRRRRPRRAAAVHRRARAAARPARLSARRHQRPDRALDEIRQLAAAQPAAHHIPADPPIRIQPGPVGHAPAGRASSGTNAAPLWFQLYRRGGRVILHHGHIRPVLIRDWSRPMDGIAATIWASQTTLPPGLTTTSSSPQHERGPARELGTADRQNRKLDLDTIAPRCPDGSCDPQLKGQLPHNLRRNRTPVSFPRCPVQPKIAKSRVSLRVTLRSPDLPRVSLPGTNRPGPLRRGHVHRSAL